MKKFLLIIFAVILTVSSVFAADAVLKAGVSIDKVPKELFRTWRVSAKITSTNADGLF